MFEKKVVNRQKQSGFTLLEIMLVLLLMGMVSVGVVMTFPNSINSEQQPQWQALRFQTLLEFAEDEALISGQDLGIVFDEKSYQFVVYDYKNEQWLAVINEQFASKIELPDTLKIEYFSSERLWEDLETQEQSSFITEEDLVSIDGEEVTVNFEPVVYVMASGEVTPFSLVFSSTNSQIESSSVTVSVAMNGVITLSGLPNG